MPNYMISPITAILTLLFCIFFMSAEQKSEYFEGEIIYDIEYQLNPTASDIEDLTFDQSIKMIMLFKDGNMYKKYYNSENDLLEERLLVLNEKKYYQRSTDNDTIYWFDITKNDSPTTYEITGKTRLLNQNCTVVRAITSLGENISFEAESIYSDELKTNRNWYKNFKEANFNGLAEKIDVILLKQVSYSTIYNKVIRATKIIHRSVDLSNHEFDFKGKPFKEI